MNGGTPARGITILKGAHVIDRAQNIDCVTDVTIEDGKIAAVGEALPREGAETIDLAGHYLTPGWVDIHVHAFGPLGFADVDSIGIYQGVTSMVDAGGPGVATLDEFVAHMSGRTLTSICCGPYIRPMGIIGLGVIEGDVRTLGGVPLNEWLDAIAEHRDLIRYLKIGAFEKYGTGPLKLGKGLAETIGVPMYAHVGELRPVDQTKGAIEIFDIAQAGDIITHIYHNNLGRIIGEDGRVLSIVRDAERRGVLFDIGYGAYNFSWDIAEQAYAQDLCPHMISSDLQQFNVAGPVFSLANVMGAFLHLGLTLPEIIDRVTIVPARALKLDDRAGSLTPGLPADITVFDVENGEYTVTDGFQKTRTTQQRIVPVMAFKQGVRVDSDLERCQDERNWLMQVAEAVPDRTSALSRRQLAFLETLLGAVDRMEWEATPYNFAKAHELQTTVRHAATANGLSLAEALTAVSDAFLESPFTIQVGLLLVHLQKSFVAARLAEIVGRQNLAA
jgi:dihydroorotase